MTKEALARILDREGLYWGYSGDDVDDPTKPRWVEIRIDGGRDRLAEARHELESQGWKFASQPDDGDDELQRLYYRKRQSLIEPDREAMLIAGYRAAVASNGVFHSWINVDDEASD